jgi:hypothetical protein
MTIRIPIISLFLTFGCFASNDKTSTNKVDKVAVERDRKTEHAGNRIKLKSKDKKDADTPSKWSTDQEFKLMFSNNPKARKPKDKKEK